MARSSIAGADRAPTQAEGRDVEALGPSDSSDSGSDVQGGIELASPTDLDRAYGAVQPGLDSGGDSLGTGERGSALPDEEPREAADIMPDEVRSLAGEAENSADAAAEAELELADLTDAGDVAAGADEEDLDEEGEDQR